MNSNYENIDYLPSATASGGKCSQFRGTFPKWTKVLLIVLGLSLVFALGGLCALWMLCNSTEEQEQERHLSPPKWTKVLLIVFAVCLVCALGGLCFLGKLYVSVSMQLSAQKTNGTDYKEQFDALRSQHKETQIKPQHRLCTLCPALDSFWRKVLLFLYGQDELDTESRSLCDSRRTSSDHKQQSKADSGLSERMESESQITGLKAIRTVRTALV